MPSRMRKTTMTRTLAVAAVLVKLAVGHDRLDLHVEDSTVIGVFTRIRRF